ncbi:MAG: DUF2752 domain-containing protein [Pirellulaceae bacterium]
MSIPRTTKPPVCRPPDLGGSDQGVVTIQPGSTIQPRSTAPQTGTLQTGTLHHWTFVIIACVVVLAAASLSVRNRQQVIVPILDQPLPGTCTFLRLTGLPCPGCGLTRSFISIAHGQLREAWRFNPTGILFFAVVLYQIPYRMWQIRRIHRGLGEHRSAAVDSWVLVGLVFVLLLQWACILITCSW